MMAVSDEGVLHVAHSSRIVALPDRDDAGVADEEIIAAGGLSWTNSIAFYKGDLYAAETNKVIRYRDNDGDLVYEEKEIIVPDLPSQGWHTSRAILFDEVKEKFYIAMGSPCDLCRLEKSVLGYSTEPISESQFGDSMIELRACGNMLF